jgi:hypothetical protein
MILYEYQFWPYSSNKHLKDRSGDLVVHVLDEVSELLGPYVVATAVGPAEAVYGVLEFEGFLALEALDDEPYLAFGELRTFFESAFVLGFRPLRLTGEIQEPRYIFSGLVFALDIAVELRQSIREITKHSHEIMPLYAPLRSFIIGIQKIVHR